MGEQDILSQIKKIVDDNDVVLFIKGTSIAPLCGFSQVVVQIFNKLKIPFKDINVLDSEEMRQGIKKYTNWPTIPQVYIKQEFIGGCDIVKEMYKNGELIEILKKQNILEINL